jgi:positive regulator of sigma E activity
MNFVTVGFISTTLLLAIAAVSSFSKHQWMAAVFSTLLGGVSSWVDVWSYRRTNRRRDAQLRG